MKTESLQAGEELAARGATHPRVTLEDIKSSVGAVFFKTADALVSDEADNETVQYLEPLSILTICVIVLKNGSTLLGKSAPASVENFDAEKGKEFAYEDALRQAWSLMGFALRDRLHNEEIRAAQMDAYMRATNQANNNNNNDLAGEEPEDVADEAGFELETAGATAADFANAGPHPIEDDETLEGSGDSYIKTLALDHGFEYVDRADAIAKLKSKRDSILAQTRA